MDPNVIYQLLQASYHPDPNVHKQAELNIRHAESNPGFLPIIVQIITSAESETGVRQAAAIYFKNRIAQSWDSSKNKILISPEDRATVKRHILEMLASVPSSVRVQLTDALKTILSVDFPDHWPEFIPNVTALLQSADSRLVYVGLLALRENVRIYQWKDGEKREPLYQIIATVFPLIQTVLTRVVNETSIEASEMLTTALKIYHNSIKIDLPLVLQDSSSLIPWGTIFLQLVEKKIPVEDLPEETEEREKYPWWKTKKWAYHCLNKLFERYGNPVSQASTSKTMDFANNFIVNFAPNILQTYLRQTELWIQKQIWVSAKCLALTAAFFRDAIKHKVTWTILKPHAETIVSHFVFPQLCYTAEDEELWETDTIDYVHDRIDPLEDINSPVINCINLLVDLAANRTKHIFMGILTFAQSILQKYLDTPLASRNPQEKDGALAMIGCLEEIIMKKKAVKAMMEAFFITHVFPEFKSQNKFLRARACDMIRRFDKLNFHPQNLAIIYQGVLGCMRDPELPVKVYAALALRTLIRHEETKNEILPNLPQVMQELLNLTNEIDVDTLSHVMEEFVEIFAEQLAPFAVQLCEQLKTTFLRIMEDVNKSQQAAWDAADIKIDVDEIGDKTAAAIGVLKTISTLILSLESAPEVLHQLETTLLPAISYTLENTCFDLYDDLFEIIDCLTFSMKAISPTMWNIFEKIYKCFKEDGIDFIDIMMPSLDNYISYGKDIVASNDSIRAMLFDIIETTMKSDRLGENDRIAACQLIESVLLHCRGHVDQFVPPFLHLAFTYISNNVINNNDFLVHVLEIPINALYYNPLLTLHIMEENNWTQGFFTSWFLNIQKFSRVHDKTLVIVALCVLLEVPAEQIPASLRVGWSQILIAILAVFKTLGKAIENRERLKNSYSVSDSSDGSDRIVQGDEDEDAGVDDDENINDEDKKYLDMLAQIAASPTDDEGEDEEVLEEELEFESPLDEIDAYIRFQDTFHLVQQHQPQSYAALTKDLSSDSQAELRRIFAIADTNRQNPPKK